MRRLYFLVPPLETAKRIVEELLLARVEERHIHILAKEGVPIESLPEAGLLQRSDLIPGLERGLALGGVAGLLAGLLALSFPPAGVVVGGGAVLATVLAGAGIGAWISSMIGAAVPNSRLKAFEEAVASGELLMLVDVAAERAEEIEELIRTHHPDAEIGGKEATVPPFP